MELLRVIRLTGFQLCLLLTPTFYCPALVFGQNDESNSIENQKKENAHSASTRFRIAYFSADVTIPLNHRCMGVLPTKSKRIVDRLYAHGFTLLLPDEKPVVFCAVDWCEIRNGSYDRWRTAFAKSAGTTRERVILASIHQHDAPVVDDDAARLLRSVGLHDELFSQKFHDNTIRRISSLIRLSLKDPVPVTHIAIGQSEVERIASNRRVQGKSGAVSYSRGSSSGRNRDFAAAPTGLIDPFLKTISFWNQDQPVLAMHSYATHPMSYYGKGGVSSDFVGLARLRRRKDDARIKQIYFSGCSGDVTAGKFNDGSPDMRKELTDRLYRAMVNAWKSNQKHPLEGIRFRNTKIELPFHEKKSLSRKELNSRLNDGELPTEKRILAAMGLASLNRVENKHPIDFPCLDLGKAKIVLFPGESFVAYQLMAQKMAPEDFVFSIGYGECWPGYIPTRSAFKDGFEDTWLWAGRGSESVLRSAMNQVLK